jgi:Fe-S-cluster containining protein
MLQLGVSAILSKLFKPADLEAIERLIPIKRRNTGFKYDLYISRIIEVLKSTHPAAVEGISADELSRIVMVVDAVGVESHGLMKRLASACPGCGWCCSQTTSIHVPAAEVKRLCRELKQKKEDIFKKLGSEWFIKKAQPCQWWNPRNGRCTIYNIRPRTCRAWPLAENWDGVHTLVAVADCHYSVGVMVYKVLGALAVAREPQAETQS